MTLPSINNAISINGVRIELGGSSGSTTSLDSAENGSYATINTNCSPYPSASNPAALSEWWSYNHNSVLYGRVDCYLQYCAGPNCANSGSLTTCDDALGSALALGDGLGGAVYDGQGNTSYSCDPPAITANYWTTVDPDYCCI
jgi:hypothetical protein